MDVQKPGRFRLRKKCFCLTSPFIGLPEWERRRIGAVSQNDGGGLDVQKPGRFRLRKKCFCLTSPFIGPIPPNLHVSIGDISKSADIARVMVGHDVAVNGAGTVTEGSTFTQLVQTVVDSTVIGLGEGGRLWQFGGAAVLNVPGTHIMAVDYRRSRRFTRHTVPTSTHFGGAHWTGQCCVPAR